ncbi:hypothetical protein F5876DRAFT_31845, partial [Lentinula aff. lateritia]
VVPSSEMGTRSQAIIVKILHEPGLPAGVLHFLSTSRAAASKSTAQIIAHSFVRKINTSPIFIPFNHTICNQFTGRNRVGRITAMEAAKHLKPRVLRGNAFVVVRVILHDPA